MEDKVRVLKFKGNHIYEVHKDCSENIAYLWEPEIISRSPYYHLHMDDNKNLVGGVDKKIILEFAGVFPTLHTYAFYGFFKPTLPEVINGLPKCCFDSELFVTTRPAADDIYDLCIGDFHIAETFVWKHPGDPSIEKLRTYTGPLWAPCLNLREKYILVSLAKKETDSDILIELSKIPLSIIDKVNYDCGSPRTQLGELIHHYSYVKCSDGSAISIYDTIPIICPIIDQVQTCRLSDILSQISVEEPCTIFTIETNTQVGNYKIFRVKKIVFNE